MALGWAGQLALEASVLYLWAPLRSCQADHPHPSGQGLTQTSAGKGNKEDRLQLARETDLLMSISPPRTPPAFTPSPQACTQGLVRISQKRQAAFQGLGARGGEVFQPGPGPAPGSGAAPSCALSITTDFDPELQSRLAGRGLRTGRPRIRSLPSGDRTLCSQQLPLFS